MNENRFNTLFPVKKPIIGMIHLAGKTHDEKVNRALEELAIFDEEGLDGAIIEDYHGDMLDVYETLRQSSELELYLKRGVNVLRDPYYSFNLGKAFGVSFVQFDSVQSNQLDVYRYKKLKEEYADIVVLGGVRFKYTQGTGRNLMQDIDEGKEYADAIVTTGSGTGIETPILKLKEFKYYMNEFPLIVGAGVNIKNVKAQLKIADGAIIGSYFKPDKNTKMKVEREKVKSLMDVVKGIREVKRFL